MESLDDRRAKMIAEFNERSRMAVVTAWFSFLIGACFLCWVVGGITFIDWRVMDVWMDVWGLLPF
jgi:hypothetical protein